MTPEASRQSARGRTRGIRKERLMKPFLIGGAQALATASILDNTLPGCHRLWSVFRRLNLGGSIEAAPQLPGRDGAVGVPGLGDPREVSRLGMNLEAVGLAHGIANAQIQDRQHIGAFEGENQEHLRRPDTYPFHLRE